MLDHVINELKLLHPQFEERREQREMWEAVYKAMKGDKKAAIHAPTGTGKSLGYVLPYIAVKLENPKFKMTISTFTINLQEQLKKDMEMGIEIYNNLLKKLDMKGKRIIYTALKGQKNYFCKKRFIENSPSELDNDKFKLVDKQLEEITVFDRQHLNMNLTFKEWESMQVDHCVKRQCPFHANCTYFQDYMNIDEKDVVITNHSLWFTRFYYVEPWENVDFFVFDEAHKLEKVLLETYTFDLSMRKFESWIEQGEKIATKFDLDGLDVQNWRDDMLFSHEGMTLWKSYFYKLESQLHNPTGTLDELKMPYEEVQQLVIELSRWQGDMYRSFLALVPKDIQNNDLFKEEQKGWVRNLLELKEFAMISNHGQKVGMLWVEKDSKEQAMLKVTPRDIEKISTPFVKGTLLTSGTLAENNSCESFAKRMKIDLDIDKCLNSPFPLSEQTMVYIGQNINPKAPEYKTLLEKEILDLLEVGTQKTFILFTSNKLMWDTFKKLNQSIRNMDTYNDQPIELWIQDKNNHKQVVESFKDQDVRSILFGTLSYFEGIDLKGDSLTQIILTRLPFSVPTHPIQQILDSKYGYSQWEALVRYEQAFGRLIRTGYDFGSFCILDNRVAYLRQFLHFFEEEGIPLVTELDDVQRFYEQQT